MWPEWANEWTDPSVILTALVIFFTAIRYVVKKEAGEIKHEVTPNSGSSMRDAIDRLELMQLHQNDVLESLSVGMTENKTIAKEAYTAARRVEERQIEHLTWHAEHKE